MSAAPVIISPPYTGATSSTSTSLDTSGCGHSTLGVSPVFHANSGRVESDLTAGSKFCSTSTYNEGGASAGVTAQIPLPAGITGNKLAVKMAFDYDAKAAIGADQCLLQNLSFSYCDVYAETYVSTYVYLIDETAGLYYFPATYLNLPAASAQVYDWCYTGSCGADVSGNQHLSVSIAAISNIKIPGGLNATHTYVLIWSIEVESYASASTYNAVLSGTSVGASLTMAGPGFGARLPWIAVL